MTRTLARPRESAMKNPRADSGGITQLPLKLKRVGKRQPRTQFAALCYREHKGELQICLVSSRGTGRWILPKGWPLHKQTPAQAAATEAWEEAGVTGKAHDICLGVYGMTKTRGKTTLPVLVMVYPIKVEKVATDWPEARQRKRRWVTPEKAARKVREPALKQIIRSFQPALIAKRGL